MRVETKDILKLQTECRQLEDSIAISKGKIQQLKSGEMEHRTIESLKEELVTLETERVTLELAYATKLSEYQRTYYEENPTQQATRPA